MQTCFECGAAAEHNHHVIPVSRGGTRTLPLCGRCHGLVHDAPQLTSTSALTRMSMERMRAEGRFTGGEPPYGYALAGPGRYVEPEPTEQAVIDKIWRMRAKGMSIRAIAATLTEAGVKMRSGEPFAPGLVQRILKRPDREPADTPRA